MNKFKTDTDTEKRFNESRNRFQYLETVTVYPFVMMFEDDSHFFTSRLLDKLYKRFFRARQTKRYVGNFRANRVLWSCPPGLLLDGVMDKLFE